MRFFKARSQLLISLGEPIADPFKSEKLHSGTCADEELAVVLDLDEIAALVASEERGFTRFAFDREILDEEKRISVGVRAVSLEPCHDRRLFFGAMIPLELGRYFAVFISCRRLHSTPVIFKFVVHKNKF